MEEDVFACVHPGCSSPATWIEFGSDGDQIRGLLCTAHWQELRILEPDQAYKFLSLASCVIKDRVERLQKPKKELAE